MKPVLIDKEWLAVVPAEGFHPISHDQLETLMGLTYDCMWGMRDEARHVIVSVTWKDSNRLMTKLVSEKAFAKQVNETFAKRNCKDGYRCNGFIERTVAGASAPAQGFRFSSSVQGIAQEGEVLVFKRGIRCYTLTYYTRSAVADENRPIYEEMLASLEVR